MPVTITINGENAEHAVAELRGLTGGFRDLRGYGNLGETSLQPGAQANTADTGAGTDAPAEPASTKGRRGRPPKVTDAVVADDPTPIVTIVEPAVEEKQPEPPAKELTLDDVRNAASGYIKRFGMDAAQVDLMSCLKAAAGVEKISELTGKDQATLEKAVKAFTAAAEAETRYIGRIA